MKKYFITFITLAITSCLTAQNTQNEGAMIKKFYTEYINHLLNESPLNMDAYMTLCAQKRIGRMSEAQEADCIISAQDYSPNMLKTLAVKPLKNHWYLVTYFFNLSDDDKTEPTQIWVKVKDNKITAIYPWKIDMEAVEAPLTPPAKILHTDVLSFAKSFYDNYLHCYLDCNKDVDTAINELQKQYGTKHLLAKIAKIKATYAEDYLMKYDPLIGSSYFDVTYLKHLKISKKGNNEIVITYKVYYIYDTKIRLRVVKQKDNTFAIDDILD